MLLEQGSRNPEIKSVPSEIKRIPSPFHRLQIRGIAGLRYQPEIIGIGKFPIHKHPIQPGIPQRRNSAQSKCRIGYPCGIGKFPLLFRGSPLHRTDGTVISALFLQKISRGINQGTLLPSDQIDLIAIDRDSKAVIFQLTARQIFPECGGKLRLIEASGKNTDRVPPFFRVHRKARIRKQLLQLFLHPGMFQTAGFQGEIFSAVKQGTKNKIQCNTQKILHGFSTSVTVFLTMGA